MQRQRSASEDRQTRASRIAVRLCTPSLDRLQINNVLLQPPSSSKRGTKRSEYTRVSPQPTPSGFKRTLFTPSSKHNLHNDKKWIAETSQRIIDYLLSSENVEFEFAARGLRQMSIKQFVAIVNFLLSNIWDDRYTVGSNHVEDIINILQKLHYPYAINKSWLKTPTAAHSYGNVILLLDFLMEFIPSSEESGHLLFELQENEQLSQINCEKNDDFHIFDLEFQQKLLTTCAEAFPLWDKQMPEYETLKQQMCNYFIQKVCNIENSYSLDLKISYMKKALEELKNERLSDDYVEGLKVKKGQLSNECSKIQGTIKSLSADIIKYNNAYQELWDTQKLLIIKIKELETENRNLNEIIKSQLCSVEQRNQLICEVDELKHCLAIKKRTVCELKSRVTKQQLVMSKMIKQNSDEVESFNSYIRQFIYSGLSHLKINIVPKLQLPVRCERHHVEELFPTLISLKEQALEIIHRNNTETQSLQQEIHHILCDMKGKLQIELINLRQSYIKDERQLQELNDIMVSTTSELYSKHEELLTEIITIQNEIKNIVEENKKLVDKVEKMKIHNEEIMSKAESDHKISIEKRKKSLEEYDAILDKYMNSLELKELEEMTQTLGENLYKLEKSLDKQTSEFQMH